MDYKQTYAAFLQKYLSLKRPLKIVCDASNGTAGIVLKELQNIQDLELILINDTPDPEFSAHGPNPLAPGATDACAKKVLEEKADMGVVFDADGDRAFFIDETGISLPSFITSAILFKQAPKPFIADELVYMSLRSMNLFGPEELLPSRVGSFFVKQNLIAHNASIGGEFSGHYYFKDFFGADSGIFAMIKMINALSIENKPLSIMRSSLPEHTIKNADVKLQKTNWEAIDAALQQHFASKGEFFTREGLTIDVRKGWINVRASNTEPLVRLTAGSTSTQQAEVLLEETKKLIATLEQ